MNEAIKNISFDDFFERIEREASYDAYMPKMTLKKSLKGFLDTSCEIFGCKAGIVFHLINGNIAIEAYHSCDDGFVISSKDALDDIERFAFDVKCFLKECGYVTLVTELRHDLEEYEKNVGCPTFIASYKRHFEKYCL